MRDGDRDREVAKVRGLGLAGCVFNPASGRQRQADVCEFQASLIYIASPRAARVTQRNPSKKKKNQQ